MKFQMVYVSYIQGSGLENPGELTCLTMPAIAANVPKERMKTNDTRARSGICSVQMSGTGTKASMKSVKIFVTVRGKRQEYGLYVQTYPYLR